MTDTLTIAVAQLDPTVGDIAGNMAKIRAGRAVAADMGADLVVFSELVVPGYPPEDLVLRPTFQRAVETAVKALAAETGSGPAVLLGAPWRSNGALHNAALLLDGGEIAEVRFKHELPNYGVFDELRVFAPAALPEAMDFRGTRLGVMICEDMWTPAVTAQLKQSGAEILIVINGSPFEADKADERLSLAIARVKESGVALIYVNQVGGQDELVFDGASFVLDATGKRAGQAPGFRSDVMATGWQRTEGGGWDCVECEMAELPQGPEAVYLAMVVGLRDYVAKNGFPGVLIGLSGGIDSALTAVVAADALGADKVHCVLMPSPFTSADSTEDALALAKELAIRFDTISIDPAMEAFSAMLAQQFAGTAPNETEENIQARARGMTLMALSNKFGHMVLSTGNKSEMSVGYATLYGDLCGGYSVLKDVYKTTVYELSNWRNQHVPADAGAVPDCLGPPGPVIPGRIITKAPSAELRPDQTDQDTLPPYEALDDILKCLIEGEMALADIAKRGHDPEVVSRVWRMVNIAEYKRRQAPPGVKLTRRSFGRDRRYPITNAFSGLGGEIE
ncbi:MAG: NAD+ synthase [Alphaproteobacteria bacterium]